jgi:hypothetical protein
MNSQKQLFSFDSAITYLNGAYMSPQLKKVEEIGIRALQQKSNPHRVTPTDFFTEVRGGAIKAFVGGPQVKNSVGATGGGWVFF